MLLVTWEGPDRTWNLEGPLTWSSRQEGSSGLNWFGAFCDGINDWLDEDKET